MTSSQDADSTQGSDSSGPGFPWYTADELSDIVLDFYQFLSTLHYDVADLKLPPPEGWPNCTREVFGDNFSDHALGVLRRLPYFASVNDGGREVVQVHMFSDLVDYSVFTADDIGERIDFDYRDESEFWTIEGTVTDPKEVIQLACGHGSGGSSLYLDTQSGEITEDVVRMNQLSSVDIKEFFNDLKEKFTSLRLIPCRGRDMIPEVEVPESSVEITEQQVISQKEPWSTDLDIQYIRQLYRHYGWPEHFQKEEAFEAVSRLMGLIEDTRGGW